MKKDYTKTDEVIRIEIFNSLRKYLNNKLSLDEFKQLSIYLSEQNPYIGKKLMPVEVFRNNNNSSRMNENTNAFYTPDTGKISVNEFFLAKRLFHTDITETIDAEVPINECCAVDFNRLLTTLGHEMKHYFQFKNVMNTEIKSHDKFYTYLNKLTNSIIYNDKEPISPVIKINSTIKFFKNNTNDEYFKKLNGNSINNLVHACYLKLFHETDARISSFHFAKGMIKTLLNDPLISKYPDVRLMLENSNKLLKNQEINYSKDDSYKNLICAEEFSARIINDFLTNKVPSDALQQINTLELQSISSMICLSSDTDKIQDVINLTTDTCAPLAMHLFGYANKIFPEKELQIDEKKLKANMYKFYNPDCEFINELEV